MNTGSPDLSPTDLPSSAEGIREVVEEEEVVVLTNKFGNGNVISLAEVIQEKMQENERKEIEAQTVPVNSPSRE